MTLNPSKSAQGAFFASLHSALDRSFASGAFKRVLNGFWLALKLAFFTLGLACLVQSCQPQIDFGSECQTFTALGGAR